MKSKIENLKIAKNKTIVFQILNFLDFSFAQFLAILNYDAREKKKLSILENLAKFLKDKKLQIKNYNKAMANYTPNNL